MTRVAILVYDDVEVLDCCGPFEVFATASRVALRRGFQTPPFTVQTIARTDGAVVARGGLQLLASTAVGDHPPVDVLVVPGGLTDHGERDQRLIAWITETAANAALTASVCTGAFLLATAGLLDGRPATTHWEDADDLERRFPTVAVRRDVRWVGDGDVVTSAGISAGIDMSLHLVQRLQSEDLARATARQMDYDWRTEA